jgi:hypothetical protein
MNTFKVTYTNGDSYMTNANGTLADFTAYLTQSFHVEENPVTGKETRLYVAKVEQIKTYQIFSLGSGYRVDEIINDIRYFSHCTSENIKTLVEKLEASTEPKPVVTFDTRSRLDFYRSL